MALVTGGWKGLAATGEGGGQVGGRVGVGLGETGLSRWYLSVPLSCQ